MKKLIKTRFIPLTMSKHFIINIKVVDMEVGRTMTEYIEEFHRCLGAHINLMENKQNLIACFIGRLRFHIKEKIKLQPFFTLSEAIMYA